MRKLLLFLFVIVPVLVVLAAVAFVVTGIEDRSLVSRSESLDAYSIARGKALATQYRESLLQPESLTTLSASEADLNRVLSLAGRSLKTAAFDVRVRSTGMLITGSVRLPKTPLGQYMNGWISIVPSKDGLDIESARIGKLNIPGWIVLTAMRRGLDVALGEARGAQTLESVREVAFVQQQVNVTYRPTPELIAQLKDVARDTYRDYAVDIDPKTVGVYYADLLSTSRASSSQRGAEFTSYLGPVMALAKQRAASGDAAVENAAAIVAMAIFFGDARFEKVVGEVRTGDLAGPIPKTDKVTIRGRHDLVQHFTISAALTVTAGLGIADVIGEVKEIADTSSDGSGFSFTDIAADRAGTRFAEVATTERGAVWAQNLLAGAPLEGMFFPSIAGLPEFMPAGEFERRFGKIGSAEYERIIRDIDQRLAGLAVFGR